MSGVMTHGEFLALVDDCIAQGKQVIGPSLVKPGLWLYARLEDARAFVPNTDGFVRPRNSIKEFLFPRHEKLYNYRFDGQSLSLEDCDPTSADMVIVGARPCDAAALPILDHLFAWDYPDKFYAERRRRTTVVTLACTEGDDECFCTSVGLGPAAEAGSDALLVPLDGHTYEVRALTEKGEALFQGKTRSSERADQPWSGPKQRAEIEGLKDFLAQHYEDAAWKDLARRCLGCGVCAYTCPTCHCFDMVDEGNALGGCRVKNWDSCQFRMFTVHASGHNPRSAQFHRQRQRLQHKFRIYPEKFGPLLCTGCGNCGRNCPVGLGILSVVREIAEAAAAPPAEAAP